MLSAVADAQRQPPEQIYLMPPLVWLFTMARACGNGRRASATLACGHRPLVGLVTFARVRTPAGPLPGKSVLMTVWFIPYRPGVQQGVTQCIVETDGLDSTAHACVRARMSMGIGQQHLCATVQEWPRHVRVVLLVGRTALCKRHQGMARPTPTHLPGRQQRMVCTRSASGQQVVSTRPTCRPGRAGAAPSGRSSAWSTRS